MDLHPSIAVRNRESGERNTYRMEQETVVMGRDRANFIILPSKSVSRAHAEIRFENGTFFIVDLGSGNGTYVNSQRLASKEKMLLRNSDKIRIEQYDITFITNGGAQPDFGEITDTDILEIKMIKKLLRAVDKENAPVLEVVSGDFEGKRFILDGKTQEIVIGRDPACEFQIDAEVISRKHARVVKKWDSVTIIDLASKNGIFVNDERISETVLSDGDRIVLGTLPMLYRNPTEHGWDYLAAEPPSQPPDQIVAPQPIPAAPATGTGRIARRSDEAGTEARPVEEPAPATPPAPPEAPATQTAEPQPPLQAETSVPLLQRFSLMEIGAASVGLAILLGSLWLLLKLL